MKTTQSSDELTKRQQNHIVFWSVFGNRRRSDWIRRRTNSPMLVSGFWASFCLNTDLTFGTRTRVYCLFAFPLSETVLIKLFAVVLNKFPPAGAQVPPPWILTYPEDHAEEEEEGLGRGDCAVHGERWVEENRGDWLPDRRMEGWKDGWMEVVAALCASDSVTAPSCSLFLFLPRSQVLWARLTVRGCDDHMVTCLRMEVGSRGCERWSRSVQLPPRHPMSLTWSLRLVNLQVTILSRWIHGR